MTGLVDALAALLAKRTGEPVSRHETHISWILLAGDEAWKLKKPVHLPFVDLRRLEDRRRLCHAEVRLNRRLAPGLYRGVLVVTGSIQAPDVAPDVAPDLDGNASSGDSSSGDSSDVTPDGAPSTTPVTTDTADGPVLDYLVRMRRFPAGALFSERLAAGTLGAREIDAMALRLARFAAKAAVQSAPALADAVVAEALKVVDQLRPIADRLDVAAPPARSRAAPPLTDALGQLRAWIGSEGERLAPVFSRRLAEGRVRDVHGDLHLANAIAVDGEVTAFDCLEFDDAMRRIDVIGDPAFLAMDLDANGRPDLGHRLVDAWCEAADDRGAVAVLPLHLVYRAAVRALVAGLSPAPDGAVRARGYLDVAERAMAQSRRPARLLITHGLSGSGKSVAALAFVTAQGALRLRSDVERKRLAGIGPLDDSAAAGLRIYTPEWSTRTYDRLADLAATVVGAGKTAVVDGAFLRRAERQGFAALAARLGVGFGIVDCSADVATLRQRIVARAAAGGDPSEATTAVLERQLRSVEPLTDDERRVVVTPPLA